jgi:ATP-dependent Clp protease ATP-binding subunit ClpX
VHTVLAAPDTPVSTPAAIIRRVSDDGRDQWCSFCGKSQHRVEAMAAAGEVRICTECLDLCDEVIADNRA